jgi:hypothetical protein
MELQNSKRTSLKAHFVQIDLTPEEQHAVASTPSLGLEKVNYLRNLRPTEEEFALLSARMGKATSVLDAARALTNDDVANLTLADYVSRLDFDEFVDFGQALSDIRSDAFTRWLSSAGVSPDVRHRVLSEIGPDTVSRSNVRTFAQDAASADGRLALLIAVLIWGSPTRAKMCYPCPCR